MEIVLWLIYLGFTMPSVSIFSYSLKKQRASGELDGIDYGVIGAMGLLWPLVFGFASIIMLCLFVGRFPDMVAKGLMGK